MALETYDTCQKGQCFPCLLVPPETAEKGHLDPPLHASENSIPDTILQWHPFEQKNQQFDALFYLAYYWHLCERA